MEKDQLPNDNIYGMSAEQEALYYKYRAERAEDENAVLLNDIHNLKEKNDNLEEENRRLRDDSAKLGYLVARQNIEITELIDKAHTDELTGLSNRRQLNETLSKYFEYAASGHVAPGLMYVDLNNFKIVNDMLGHEFGDHLLTIVSDLLVTSLRVRAEDDDREHGTHKDVVSIKSQPANNEALIGREGGDEFVIAVDLGPSDAETGPIHRDYLEKIRIRIIENFESMLEELDLEIIVDGLETTLGAFLADIKFGLSIGVSVYDRYESLLELKKRAEEDMYDQKKKSKITLAK